MPALVAATRPLILAPTMQIGTTIVRDGLDYDVTVEYVVYNRDADGYLFLIVDFDFDPVEDDGEPLTIEERAGLEAWFNANWELASEMADEIYGPE